MATYPPIAVVGVSALFPGSTTSEGFWRDILAGNDLLSEVPTSHWLVEDYYDPDPDTPDATYARRGGFVPDVEFSPVKFGVPPNILKVTDSLQLLTLIVARRLLEDALGAAFSNVDDQISVILGVAGTSELSLHMGGRLQKPIYERAMRRSGLDEEQIEAVSEEVSEMFVPWEENVFPGLLGNVVAGRVANRFDLDGTNCTVDAACAGTLAAVEAAINQLAVGQSDMVLTGGMDALNDILMFMCFGETSALSEKGDCRPFSAEADGVMLAEGVGMFALKRLEDAEENGDQIYAVIRGVGSSSDGRAKSIYAPRAAGQAKAVRRTYEAAGYSPETVELLEAHGTATPAGDAAEIDGLRPVFGEGLDESEAQWCALGSVKSQIGHAKAAAGAAGLYKAVMALHHGVLPPTIKVEEPNPKLELDQSPFYLNSETRPWIRGSGHPRRASVSAFGFGGTNFHATLEEYDGPAERPSKIRSTGSELVLLSEQTPEALADACREWSGELDKSGMLEFLAKTTQEEFDPDQPARVAIVASDEDDLRQKLESAAERIGAHGEESFSAPNGMHYGFEETPGRVAFLFPGQGSQYVGMGDDLTMQFETVRRTWDRASDFEFEEGRAVGDVVYPMPAFTEEERERQAERLTATEWAQPAIGTVSASMVDLLVELGLEPDAAGGHSYGEVTALWAAGVLDDESMLEVSRRRGELMAKASSESGAMTAVSISPAELEVKLEEWESDLVIANQNSPRQSVLSGTVEAIEQVERRLQRLDITCKRLPVSTAFHSSLVSDSTGPFRDHLERVEFEEPVFPVYANATAEPYPSEPAEIRSQLAEQIARPVRFADQIEAMYEAGVRTFLEVGPSDVLGRLIEECLGDRPHNCISLDKRKKEGVGTLWNALGRLSIAGIALDFEPVWRNYGEIEDPREREEPSFTVSINGANYEKPYPPEGWEDEQTPSSSEETKSSGGRNGNGALMDERPEPTPPRPTPSRPTSSRPATSDAAESEGWVRAYQDQQRQMAEVHRTYQETMAQVHREFLETMDASFGTLSRAGELAEEDLEPMQSKPSTPAYSEYERPAPPATKTDESGLDGEPEPAREPESPTSDGSEQTDELEQPGEISSLLLEIVADKTGYPVSMLEPDMDIESDLGIDSIKRVEILSEMEDRVTELPEMEMDEMAEMETLEEIAAYMEASMGA